MAELVDQERDEGHSASLHVVPQGLPGDDIDVELEWHANWSWHQQVPTFATSPSRHRHLMEIIFNVMLVVILANLLGWDAELSSSTSWNTLHRHRRRRNNNAKEIGM